MNRTKIMDVLSGKNVWEYYQEYKKSQWYSESDLKQIKINKFKKLVEHCYLNVPYYRKFMNKVGIVPSDVVDLSIIENFPIVTKEIIKSNYKEFIPSNLNTIKGVKVAQTGGTTGNILLKRNDAKSRGAVWGAFRRFEDWMNYKPGDKALILMGGHVIKHKNLVYLKSMLKKKMVDLINNQISFNPYETSSEDIENIIYALKKYNFKLIRGYSQYLYNLSKLLQNRGLHFNIPSITTTAEPLLQIHRDIFKKVFGAESFDQYGCGEVGGIAFECEKHEGLHITEEHVIIEINENNEMIVTDLDNFAMPFIRYWNADQILLSDKECSCGRKHKLIKKVLGRVCDYIIGINGEYLHWAYFWHLVFDSGISEKYDLRKFQIVQKNREAIVFRYVAKKLSMEDERKLTDNIRYRLGDIKITFVQENNIENSKSGKYRPVINELLS